MVPASEPFAQQCGKDDSLNVFISRIRRIDQFIQEGLSYHKANVDYDNALSQMEVFSFLNDWSTKLVRGICSQGVLSLLEEIIEIVDKDSSTALCLMNRIHRKYTEWYKSKSSQQSPESVGPGSTGVLGKSQRERSPSPDDSKAIKKQGMAVSKVEDTVDNFDKQVPATDSAESSSSQSTPDSGSPAVLGKSPRERSSSPKECQPIKRQSMVISEDEDSDQDPDTDCAESSSSQSTPDSGSTAVLGESPRERSTSPDDSQPTERQSMPVSEDEISVYSIDSSTDSAECSSSKSTPDSGSTAVLGKSPRKRSRSPDDSQPIKRRSMDVSEVEDPIDKQVPATVRAEPSSSQSKFGVSPRFVVEFTDEDNKRLTRLLYGPHGQVIVFKFNIRVARSDIRTLYGSNWLNDNVINFYMELLNERSQQRVGQLPSVYAMNSYFLRQLASKGYFAVRRWTRRVDIFSKHIITVPVHFNTKPNHWSMAIIDMRNKTIRSYDSMGLTYAATLKVLATYLEQESADKRQQPFDTSCFKIESVRGVPRQYNGNDCGVFCCMFAEYLTRNAPLTFSQRHMVAFRKKMMLEIADGKLWT